MNKQLLKLERSFYEWIEQLEESLNDCFFVTLLYRIRIEITDFDATSAK